MAADSQFVLRVLEVAAEHDVRDSISWRTDGEYAPVSFWVNCNDVFFWACSDSEDLTPANIDELDRACADCQAADADDCTAVLRGPDLFAARMRRMRPQGCAYPANKKLWPLFDACGPERSNDGNNHKRPE